MLRSMTKRHVFMTALLLYVAPFLAADLHATKPSDVAITLQNPSSTPRPTIPLTPEEAAWLKEHKTIRIAGPKDFPPFHYYEEDGTVKGMSYDYTRFLMERLDVQMEAQPNLPWPEILKRARQKEIDVVACAAKSAEREEYLSFSEPYLNFPLVVISRKESRFIGGIEDLHGKRVALIKGVMTGDWLKQDKIDIIPHYVNTPLEALVAVSTNAADAHIENLAAAGYMIEKNGLANLKVAAPTSYGNYSLYFAVRKDWQPLVSIINKALASMTPGEQAAIRNKWLSVRYEYGISTANVIKWISGIVGIAALILMMILYWNRKLSREIRGRQRVEEALRESEEKYRTLFSNERTAIYIFELDTLQLLDVNDALVRIYGYSREELLHGMRLTHISAEPEESEGAVMQAFKQGTVFIPLRWHRKKDGTVFPVEIVGGGYTWKGKWVMFGIAQDITARRQAEESLRVKTEQLLESNKLLENVLKHTNMMTVFLDQRFNFIWVNRAYADTCKQDPSFFQGKNHFDLYPHKENQAIFQQVVDSGESFFVSAKPFEFPDQPERGMTWWDWSLIPVKNDTGKVTNLVFTLTEVTERIRAAEEQMKSEQQHLAILKTAMDGFLLVDRQGRLLEVNEAYCRMSGYGTQELLTMNIPDLEASETRDQTATHIQRVMVQGKDRFTSRHRRKDGALFDVEISVQYRSADGGQFVCFVQDITERKLSDEKLRESEERHRRIIEVLSDAILLRSNDLITYANAAALKLFRADHLNDLIGKRYLDLIHPDDRAMSAVRVKKILEEDRIASLREHRVLTLDGEVTQVESSGVPFKYRGETQVFGVFRDITERKRAEEIMRNAAHEWSTSFDAMPDGVSIHDSNHTIVRVNHTLCQLLGKDAEELIGKKCYEIFHGTDNPIAACPIELSRKTRKKEQIEFFDSFLNKWLSVSSSPLFDESGQLKQLVHIIRDITNRKEEEEENAKLQAQLLQSQKMESIGRLAGGIAHDFNNMLGVILGHAEMALEEADPKKLHADLEEIRKAASRSADLTTQLLAFARKQTVSPRVLDLNETVEGMLKMLRRLIGEDVNLAWLPGANGWPIKMDPSQINQILTNLSVNARDAISGVGRVTIETQNVHCDEAYSFDHPGCIPGDYLLLSVSDDGSGMDKETQGKLFEPFFTTKGIGKGTGLGLATVYGIVKQNAGFIDVSSLPGQGTTFKIYLPRHIGKVEKAQTEGIREAVVTGHETILVVEDEPSLLELSSLILRKQGYRVLAAATPGEAIRLAEEYSGEIHLLMTDLVMPEMNGRDLAKKILSLYPEIKRLFMSGYTADVIAHHGVLDEEVQFIQKPFSRKSLTTKIRRALDQKWEWDGKTAGSTSPITSGDSQNYIKSGIPGS